VGIIPEMLRPHGGTIRAPIACNTAMSCIGGARARTGPLLGLRVTTALLVTAALLAGGCGKGFTEVSLDGGGGVRPGSDARPRDLGAGPTDAPVSGGDAAAGPDTRDAAGGLAPADSAPPLDARGTSDTRGGPDAPGAGADLGAANPGGGPMPPATWQEHWFEHVQNVKLIAFDDHAAIYADDDVDRQSASWLLPFMSRLWQYSKNTYGAFGNDPHIYSIHHQGRYSGGHPSTYFDASHDNRNVSDCGPGPWGMGAVDLPSHEVAHVVEGANNGVHGSPAFPIWRDSKWAEIYQYDVYLALGMTADAQRLHTRFSATTDSFPRAGTRWFRDWFFPLYRDRGGIQVMVRFFRLLAMHFPKANTAGGGRRYTRDLNFGEYVHFTSGAAGADLKPLATTAFGWPAEREAEWAKARADFPGVTY
jgi:hypothetical protein